MKTLKKSLCIVTLLCAGICANSFAMKKALKKTYVLTTPEQKMDYVRLLKKTENPYPAIPVLIELANQDKNKEIKLEALNELQGFGAPYLNQLTKHLLLEFAVQNKNKKVTLTIKDFENFCLCLNNVGAIIFRQKKDINGALECYNNIIEISKRVEIIAIKQLALEAKYNMAQIHLWAVKNLVLMRDCMEASKKAIGCYESVINSDIDYVYKVSALLNITIPKYYLGKGERKTEKEINKDIKSYLFRCLEKAEKGLREYKKVNVLYRDIESIRRTEIFKREAFSKLSKYDLNEQEQCKLSKYKNKIENKNVCNECGKEDKDLQRCSQCQKVFYCSRACQKKDWKEHKKVCKKISKINKK